MNQTKITVGFAKITHSIEFSPMATRDGIELADSHIQDVCEQGNTLAGSVWPSMRQGAGVKPYSVKAKVLLLLTILSKFKNFYLQLDDSRQVTSVFCSCQSGLSGSCKHIMAMLYFVNNEPDKSCTGTGQKWGVPGKPSDANKRMSEIVDEKSPDPKIKTVDVGPVLALLHSIDSPFSRYHQIKENMKKYFEISSLFNFPLLPSSLRSTNDYSFSRRWLSLSLLSTF